MSKLDDYLNMSIQDFNKLPADELKKVVQYMGDITRKRYKTLVNRPDIAEGSRALQGLVDSGGLIKTKGKNLNELRAEFSRAKTFLGSKTSTITGSKALMRDVIDKLSDNGINISKEQYNEFWHTYERLKSIDPSINEKSMKYRVMQEISQSFNDGLDMEEVTADMLIRMTEIYEELIDDDFTGVSEFFDF